MNDIVSINRQFLFLARERANSIPKIANYDAVTGLSKTMLDRISQLSVTEIEELAQSDISLFTLRISEKQIDKIVSSVQDNKRQAYILAGLQVSSIPT